MFYGYHSLWCFLFNDTATTESYTYGHTLSLHVALPICQSRTGEFARWGMVVAVTSLGAFAAGLTWGAVGVAAAYGLSDLFIRARIIWWWVGRRGPVETRDFVKIVLPHATALRALFTVIALLNRRTIFSWLFLDFGDRGLI